MEQRKFNIKTLCIGLFLVVILLSAFACEPYTEITLQNQHNQDIELFVAHLRDDGTIGFVSYGKYSAQTNTVMTITFLGDEWVNRIKAVDSSGNEVFLHDYTRKDLEKIDWTITIPPSQNN